MRTFGLGLMKLDIRQESTRHAEVMDTITRFLDLGSYLEWDEVSLFKVLPLTLTQILCSCMLLEQGQLHGVG